MLRSALLALAAGAIAAAPAAAQTSVADFYRGKNIDVYIGLSVGGLYDINARTLARFMGRHIPGNPSLVPRNMVGAAGLRLANWLYQVAPKDGTAIGTFVRGIPFAPLLGEAGIAGDAAKFNWLGSANDEVSICAARRESGVTRLEQVRDHELIVGSTGGSGDDEQMPRILNGVLGTKFRTVTGFPGGAEIKLAMLRGEVSGRCGWSWSSVKATEGDWLKDGSISILAQLSFHKHPDLPDVPLVTDFAKTEDDRQIFKVLLSRQVMAWPFAAPPGVPAERVAALRAAFDATLRDKDFLAEAQRLNLEIMPVSGERIQALIEDVFRTTSPQITARIGAMLK